MSDLKKYSLLCLRLVMASFFTYAGYSKVITFFTEAKNWTATGFLTNAGGPFPELYASMANNIVIDYLNAYGLLLIGIALLLGVFVRLASYSGALMMLLYYFPGYPPEHAFIVDDHIIYIVVFFVLAAYGAGRFVGLDSLIEKHSLVKKNRWLLKFLG